MAPEVYKSQPYGAAADQYSLGMVLYWLLNERRTPFLPLPSAVKVTTVTMEDAARKRRFDGEQIPPPAHGSKQLQAITLRACAYDPKNRFASAAEMLESLKALKNGSASPSVAVPMGAASFSVMSRARIMERGVRSGRDRETDCCGSHQNTTARQSARSASRKTRSAPDSAVQSLGDGELPPDAKLPAREQRKRGQKLGAGSLHGYEEQQRAGKQNGAGPAWHLHGKGRDQGGRVQGKKGQTPGDLKNQLQEGSCPGELAHGAFLRKD